MSTENEVLPAESEIDAYLIGDLINVDQTAITTVLDKNKISDNSHQTNLSCECVKCHSLLNKEPDSSNHVSLDEKNN